MIPDFSPLAGLGKIDFYLLRHGKSEGNHSDIIQGRLDYALSDTGREQARLTGQWLGGRGIRFVRCTPLSRGAETARIVCAEAGTPEPEILGDLIELDTGVFTGLTLEEAKARHPDEWQVFLRKSWDGVRDAEPSARLRERAVSAWTALISLAGKPAAGPGVNPPSPFGVLAVAHAGILQWLIKTVSGGDGWFPLYPMGHCGIYHLSVEGNVIRWEKLNFQVPGVTGKR